MLANNYEQWMLKIPKNKKQTPQNTIRSRHPEKVTIPYVRGFSEKLESVYKKHGINIIHKPFNTLRDHLVHPKDETEFEKQCGVIYDIPCANCDNHYIGETARQIGIRITEHQTKNALLYTHI